MNYIKLFVRVRNLGKLSAPVSKKLKHVLLNLLILGTLGKEDQEYIYCSGISIFIVQLNR